MARAVVCDGRLYVTHARFTVIRGRTEAQDDILYFGIIDGHHMLGNVDECVRLGLLTERVTGEQKLRGAA